MYQAAFWIKSSKADGKVITVLRKYVIPFDEPNDRLGVNDERRSPPRPRVGTQNSLLPALEFRACQIGLFPRYKPSPAIPLVSPAC